MTSRDLTPASATVRHDPALKLLHSRSPVRDERSRRFDDARNVRGVLPGEAFERVESLGGESDGATLHRRQGS